MKVATIIRNVDNLDRSDKIAVMNHINKSLLREKGNNYMARLEKRFEECKKAAEETTGVDFFEHTRRRIVVLTRAMVAYTLLKEGFFSLRVGEVFGQDHSTLFNLKRKIETILELPSVYRDEYNAYCSYIKKLKDYEE